MLPNSMPLAISLPAASRPSLRQLLNRWKKCRQRTLTGIRCLGIAGGLAASGLAAVGAGGLPPFHGTLYSAATGGGCGSGSSGSGNGGLGDPSRRVTDILLVANVALFGLQFFTKQALTAWGHKSNQLIVAGQWWRLLTSAFLHADVFHLWLNCSALNNLGPLMEDRMGRPRYIATYLVAAVAGSLASFIGCPSPSLGASGAIFGVGGAMAVYFHRNKDHYGEASVLILGQLFKNLLINVLYGIMSRRRRIDHWCHMGGLVGGALAAYLLGPNYVVGRLPGQCGSYLIDQPPLPVLRSPPRPITLWGVPCQIDE